MVTQVIVLLPRKFTCRCPPFLAVWFSQPKTESAFHNFKGQTAVLRIINLLAQFRIFFRIGSQSVFETGIVGADCNPRTCFIKVYLCGFLRLFKSCFHRFTLLSKITCFFFVFVIGLFLTVFSQFNTC